MAPKCAISPSGYRSGISLPSTGAFKVPDGDPAVTRGPYSTAVQVGRRTPTAEAMTRGPSHEAAARIMVIGLAVAIRLCILSG